MENVNKQLLDALSQLDLAETEVTNAKAWSAGEQAKAHCDFALTAIATARQAIAAAEQAQQADIGKAISQQSEPVAWEVSATKGNMPRQKKLLKHEAAALAAADHWKLVGCDVAVRGLVYAQADAAQPPVVAVPDGYALVPVVATDKMRAAGRIGIQRGIKFVAELTPSECGLVWAYMVKAAAQKGGA